MVGDKGSGQGQYKQYKAGPYTQAGANQCDAAGWYGEETLDVESVHGMAPDANVRYVAAGSCQDSDLAQADAYIVNNGLASIVSNSWGEPDSYSTMSDAFNAIFELGAVEGVGFFFSSGDSGYEGPGEDPVSPYDQVDFPTSSPYVTSVGGTSLAIGKTNNYQWETSWGTLLDPLVHTKTGKKWQFTPPGKYPAYYDGSGGGGVSTVYTQPFYQAGVVPDRAGREAAERHDQQPCRCGWMPDVSALADPSTGILVGQTTLQPDGKTYAFSLSRIGGTSVACPTFAGIQADAQQAVGKGTARLRQPADLLPGRHDTYGRLGGVQRRDRPPAGSRPPRLRCATTTPTRTPSRARWSPTCGPWASTARARTRCRPSRATTTRPVSARPAITSSPTDRSTHTGNRT